MTMYSRIDVETTGKYCEMLALAEFTGKGHQVAIPFGNQAKWDFLIEENGKFRKVQVKTATPKPSGIFTVMLRRCSGAKGRPAAERTYSLTDIDYLVAVCPENRGIWKIPVEAVAGKTHLTLTLDSTCLSSHDASVAMPIYIPRKRRDGTPRLRGAGQQPTLRPLLIGCMPTERPAWMLAPTWEMAQRCAAGESWNQIGKAYGIRGDGVRKRIELAVKKLTREYPLTLLMNGVEK